MTPPQETTIIQPALLPCPLCHGEAEYTWNQLYSANTMATCRSCGCSAFWRKWNTRAQPAPVEQDVERLADVAAAISMSRFRRQFPYIPEDQIKGIIPDALDIEDATAALSAISTLTPARAEGFKAGDYNYTQLFNAIAAATSVYGGGTGVNVSVKAFLDALKESE